MSIQKRDIEIYAGTIMETATYVHYLQLFIFKDIISTLIAGIVFD